MVIILFFRYTVLEFSKEGGGTRAKWDTVSIEISRIQNVVSNELQLLERIIAKSNQSDVSLANSVCQHLIQSQGKRIRPMVLILSALASGYQSHENLHLDLACIIEFIHTATLLHDDVIDNGDQRRHQPTAHTLWGNTASILSGDLLYAKAFRKIAEIKSPAVLQVLAEATEKIVEGELEHLQCKRKITTSKLTYLNVISAKTAKLFSVATHLGCMISTNIDCIDSMAEYGHHLGIIFQIMDDILDIESPNTLGKPKGQDVLEGKPTLPLILAYEHASPEDKQTIEDLFLDEKTTIEDLAPFIEKTNAIALAKQEAHTACNLAKDCLKVLPDSEYKDALADLVDFAYSRNH